MFTRRKISYKAGDSEKWTKMFEQFELERKQRNELERKCQKS